MRLNPTIESLEPRALLAAPIVISKGGTYTGTWESKNPDIPAITIDTAAPVIIQNSTVRGPGTLIANVVDHVNVTIKNTWGYGTNPNVLGESKGRFAGFDNFNNVKIDSCHLEGTQGILLVNYLGNRTSANTIVVTGNFAHNIDGRKSNGKGGWLDFNRRVGIKVGKVETGYDDCSFVQLNKVRAVPNVVIAWNQVINDPVNSRVEDNISIYKSSGTSASPIRIHHNYIRGAYTVRPWQKSWKDATTIYDWSYSGGGINLGDGVGATPAEDSAYVKAYYNTVVSTTNYGIALAAGHNLEAYGNRIVSCGKLPDGRTIAQQNVGLYVWDSYGTGFSRFYNNTAHDNTSGWVTSAGGRNDWWAPDAKSFLNNIHWAGTITASTEKAELTRWLKQRG